MSRYHGITEDTYERFVVDAGQVRMGFVDVDNPGTLLGATRGGSSFTVETEYKEMSVDGAKGPVQGGRRITKVSVAMSVNFVEWSTDLIKILQPGSSETLSGDYDSISRSLQLGNSNYLSNIALIGEVSDPASGPAIFILRRALADGNLEIAMSDAEEAVLKAQFTGHFSPTDLDTEPWIIMWPHDSNPPTTTIGS